MIRVRSFFSVEWRRRGRGVDSRNPVCVAATGTSV
jgi:hypothetical protein